jgi:exodeoxyribonuclease V alpha subunit
VLADLIASPAVQVFRLSVIHRTAAGSGVPMLANQIRLGIKPRFRIDPADGKLRELTRADADPYFDGRTTRFVPRDTPEDIAAYIIAKIEASPERVPDIQVLCPMNKGAAGTHALNRALQAALNPAAPGKPSVRGAGGVELRVGDRVYCGDNLPAHDLYNGEVGYLRDIAQDGTLLLEMDGDERRLPTDMADSLSLAYAMSVHKAQGSEFPIVMIPLHPSAYMLLRRRLLYTAVSRARQTVVVVGTPKALGIAIGRDEDVSRQTLLRGYLAAGSSAPPAPIALPDDELF